jgi:membrane associated rhomboid family serine protease
VLIVLNLVAFAYELLLGPDVDLLISTWGAVPAYVTHTSDYPLGWATLFTSMFLHAGWTHLVGNMLYFWIFGDNVEDALGHVGFLIFYLAAGVLAGLAQIVPDPNSQIPAIGASGAVAGVLGTYLVLHPGAPIRVIVLGLYFTRLRRIPAIFVLGMWFVIQLFNGALSLGSGEMATGGVAWFAHIGGFVCGLLVGLFLRATKPRSGMPRRYLG